MATADRRGIRGLADRANPAFAAGAVVIPVGALAYALALGDLRTLFYVHVMAGVLWTGIDVFMGAILGPVIGGLDPEEKASVFTRFTPKMTFFMPVVAAVTITAGIELAREMGYWAAGGHWLLAALGVAGLLSVIGFGIILPNEIRIYREIVSSSPDTDKISRLGMRNAKLGGVQGLLQLLIIFVMVNLRL
ncbi:hypothetical protein [Halorussus amylolyticus]|uniref:hypothetical protein n=1 Tax=Halorussus amylolyticus TaxID=1126242 RepID=UPI0010510E1C|nr:hypothetical protein [Halorussus amylolyticus]